MKLYNEHKDIVNELLLKKEVYTESYMEGTVEIFEFFFRLIVTTIT